MKPVLLTLIILQLLFSSPNLFPDPQKSETYPPVIVMELFTSQGCSSCPPADELMTAVKNSSKTNVIALSYHVDYWNYIGWKDPFSKSEYSDKQRKYGSKFNSSSIYTPQLVVNGEMHFVGSNQSKMNNAISNFGKKSAQNQVEIFNVVKSKDKIDFEFEIKGSTEKKKIRIVLVIEERITEINRGENRNRTLKNTNIVITESLSSIDKISGKSQIEVPDMVYAKDDLKLIVIVQDANADIHGTSQAAIN